MTIGSNKFGVRPPTTQAPTTARTRTRRSVKGKVLLPLVFVAALILIACGGGSGDRDQKLPSISSGSEVEMDQDLAPNFTLKTDTGGSLTLADYRGSKNVVLYFYPKDDTTG